MFWRELRTPKCRGVVALLCGGGGEEIVVTLPSSPSSPGYVENVCDWPSASLIAGLGEQCFQDDTCQLHDKHAVCAQVDHNAICKCKQGYHIVTVSRPTNARSSFCAQGG